MEAAMMKEFHLGNQTHYIEAPDDQGEQRSKFRWMLDSGLLNNQLIFGHFIHVRRLHPPADRQSRRLHVLEPSLKRTPRLRRSRRYSEVPQDGHSRWHGRRWRSQRRPRGPLRKHAHRPLRHSRQVRRRHRHEPLPGPLATHHGLRRRPQRER